MTEQAEVTPEVIAEAASMGWSPKEKWRGDPSQWIDAPEFLRRGREILPIIRAQNRSLADANAALKGEVTELRGSMEAFVKQQTELTEQRLEAQRKQLTKELRTARRGDDPEEEERLEDALEANEAERQRLKDTPKPAPAKDTPHPAFLAWKAENPWFGVDEDRTAMAEAFGAVGAKKGLQGQALFDFVDSKMPKPARAPAEKVENGGPSGSGGGGNGKSDYASLPAEAKAVCDRQEALFVGPNKVFKDQAAWRKHYVAQYTKE